MDKVIELLVEEQLAMFEEIKFNNAIGNIIEVEKRYLYIDNLQKAILTIQAKELSQDK